MCGSNVLPEVEKYTFDEFVEKYPGVYSLEELECVEDELHDWEDEIYEFIAMPVVNVNVVNWQEDDEARVFISAISLGISRVVPFGRDPKETTGGVELHKLALYSCERYECRTKEMEEERNTYSMREYMDKYVSITFTVWSVPVSSENAFIDEVVRRVNLGRN